MHTVFAYLRLSREDLAEPGRTDEKFGRQAATARELAERYGVDLPEPNILIERESGRRLRNRPVLLRLLDLMHAGKCDTLITPFADRVSRLEDKREQADLEDALYAGCVTIISRDGVDRYDEERNPLPSEMMAAFARYELRVHRRRRMEGNRQRLAQNRRSSGIAPYGYRRDKTDPSGYVTVPTEYGILCEILRRALDGESLRSIALDLNARLVPTPTASRTGQPAGTWRRTTLRAIVANPFYAGYHARRKAPTRGGQYRQLPVEEYELSQGEPGTWPQPITLAQWHLIQSRWAGQRGHRPATHILSGILHCHEGAPVRANGGKVPMYRCECPGKHCTSRRKWEWFARCLMCAFIAAIPDAYLDRPVEPMTDDHRASVERQLQLALRVAADRQREHDALMRDVIDPSSYLRRFERSDVERLIDQTKADLTAARRRVEELTAARSAPDRAEVVTVLRALRAIGAERVWDEADDARRRAIVQACIKRIVMEPNAGRNCAIRRAQIEWHDWVVEDGLQVKPDWAWLKRPVNRGSFGY